MTLFHLKMMLMTVTSIFSDLCIAMDPQMEFEHSDLIHYMHSLIPSDQHDPMHTERFTQYLKLMSSEKFLISNVLSVVQ